MSPNEIIAMARDANPEHDLTSMLPFLSRFAALVAAKEREACAQACEEVARKYEERHHRRAKDGRAQHPGPDCGLHSQQEGDQVHGDTLNQEAYPPQPRKSGLFNWENEMQVKRIDSSDENVSKYVFDFGNAVAEAVLYKYPTYEERTVICCSTQSGCPVGCRFCGAGDAFVRSLTGDEIVAQVQHLFADRGIEPEAVQRCQIMFMSMGEPLLNFGGLADAIRKLHALYPRFALLISTSAPSVDYERVRALSIEVPAVGLQFSVHESTDEARNALIPFKAKLDLAQIATEGERWFAATGRQPFFNYCAHESNTTPEDALRIYNLFNPAVWQATISVVCERDESVAAANVRQRQLAQDFMQKLMHYGYSTRCFDPAGQDDIGGGCGQLWFVQDWMRNNPELAKPSVGRTIPIVHAPSCIA